MTSVLITIQIKIESSKTISRNKRKVVSVIEILTLNGGLTFHFALIIKFAFLVIEVQTVKILLKSDLFKNQI